MATWSAAMSLPAIGWFCGHPIRPWKSPGRRSREAGPGMVHMDILMPQLGETVAEGRITKWFKAAGDAVKPGDNLFEIETDKVSMEVPSTTAGVLSEIRVGAGDVAPVGAVVAVIADGSGATTAVPPPPRTPAKAGVQQQAPLDSRVRGNERKQQTSASPLPTVN